MRAPSAGRGPREARPNPQRRRDRRRWHRAASGGCYSTPGENANTCPGRLRDPRPADGRQPLPRRSARSTSANCSATRAAAAAPARCSTNRPNGSKSGWPKTPSDEQLLLHADAGADQRRQRADRSRLGNRSSRPSPPKRARNFEAGCEAWSRYLKQAGDEPSPTAAQLVAGTFFRLAESARPACSKSEENVAKAAKAQRIAAEAAAQPRLAQHPGDLRVLQRRIRRWRQDRQSRRRPRLAPRPKPRAIEKQLAEYRKRGEAVRRQKQEARQSPGKQAGKEQLQNPLRPGRPPSARSANSAASVLRVGRVGSNLQP